MFLQNRCGSFLGIIVKSGNMVFGSKCVKEDLKRRRIKLILLASDLSDKSKCSMVLSAEKEKTECIQLEFKMGDIGSFVGRSTGVLGIKNSEMALKFKKILEESQF